MSRPNNECIPEEALGGSLREYRTPKGPNLLKRVEEFYAWQDLRRDHGLWPYGRSADTGPDTTSIARDDSGRPMKGINFASQDYLSMVANPKIKTAARRAVDGFGVHSAGSPAFVGNTSASVALERTIADFLKMQEVVLFPTGWAAGFGVIKGLVRPADHIVMDSLAHACLQEGAAAATRNVYPFRHLQVSEARRWLTKIRATDTENAILVVTEGLFSMDSDVPDIAAMQALCDEFNATLMVDVAHDLGCLGEDGRGQIGIQGMLGKVDIVMGSFSKTFASNGGFVATKSRAVKEYLRYFSSPGIFSNAMSPVQAMTVLKAFEIVGSDEGRALRASLMTNIKMLREQLVANGFEVYGEPSAIVAVAMGNEALGRLVGRRLPDLGLVANLVEFPAVAKGHARFRLQVMANHTPDDIIEAVHRLRAACDQAAIEYAAMNEPEFKAIA